ncbi:MAG: FAD:protein FMN transferase [Magnetococcus sp. MYC-9]
MTTRKTVVGFVLLWMLVIVGMAGCGKPLPESHKVTRLLMGTIVSITVWGEPGRFDREEQAIQAAFAEMERIERVVSSHRPDSVVATINQGERGRWLPLDPEVGRILEPALRIQERSGGAFDPTLYALSRLWGFSQEPPPDRPPPAELRERWLAGRQQAGRLQLRSTDHGQELLLPNDSFALDLGAIAKGYAVDRALARLAEAGVANAIVAAGGDLGMIGQRGAEPWRIGIQHPRDATAVAAVLRLQGPVALSTSGDYERFFMHDGKRYHHILDPGTALPGESGVISVSVRHPASMVADALSTAAFILGPEKGMALIRSEKNAEALFILADGRHVATEGFATEWVGKP